MKKRQLFLVRAWCLSLIAYTKVVLAKAPHPHQGKIAPFASGDPGVELDRHALSILASGHPYKTQVLAADDHKSSSKAGRGMVVQDVHAPTHIVWERILDFNHYPEMVPKTVECQIYRSTLLAPGDHHHHHHGKKQQQQLPEQRIWVRMKIGFPLLKFQFFVNHLFEPDQNSLTWTLDYSEHSDIDDSVGYWYVIPHPDDPQHMSRVYYSVQVSLYNWVPQFVVDFMSKQALMDATAWVKKYSELEAEKQGIAPTDAIPRKSGPWLPWKKSRPKSSSPPQDSSSLSSDATSLAPRPESSGAVSESSSSAVAAAAQQLPQDSEKERIGVKRYALVGTVLALSFYNVHLYFSQ